VKQYYNNKHQKAPLIREGEKVFLLQQNIKTKQSCNKLNYKKLRPFRIREKIRLLNYKLELSEIMRIHLIFHVSLLEKALQNTRQQEVKVEPEIKYKVDRILDHDKISGQEQYLVKWKGYLPSENTWESKKHLQNAQKALSSYL
jgi:hypothetical protein